MHLHSKKMNSQNKILINSDWISTKIIINSVISYTVGEQYSYLIAIQVCK